jgi:hypothetical protein
MTGAGSAMAGGASVVTTKPIDAAANPAPAILRSAINLRFRAAAAAPGGGMVDFVW